MLPPRTNPSRNPRRICLRSDTAPSAPPDGRAATRAAAERDVEGQRQTVAGRKASAVGDGERPSAKELKKGAKPRGMRGFAFARARRFGDERGGQEKNEQKKQRNKRSARKTRSRPIKRGGRKARKRILSPPENSKITPDPQEGEKTRGIFPPLLFSGVLRRSIIKNTKKYNSFRRFVEYLPVSDTPSCLFPTTVGFV